MFLLVSVWISRCVVPGHARASPLVLQLPDPDVSEQNRVAVVLKGERACVVVRFVGRYGMRAAPACAARKLIVVLDQYTVVEYGEGSSLDHFVVLEDRAVEDYVVCLPLCRFEASVDERRLAAVDRRCMTVGVGYVVIRVKNLDFIYPHEEHTAVATILTVPLDFLRSGKLDVKLA